jgi:hypothetical protein
MTHEKYDRQFRVMCLQALSHASFVYLRVAHVAQLSEYHEWLSTVTRAYYRRSTGTGLHKDKSSGKTNSTEPEHDLIEADQLFPCE